MKLDHFLILVFQLIRQYSAILSECGNKIHRYCRSSLFNVAITTGIWSAFLWYMDDIKG